ncbi:MAG: glycosyltransferase family A protein [Kofleriaceae bacterium]
MMELSVVIPTAGKWSRLERTLRGLAAAAPRPERFEVVLVLDGVAAPADLRDHGLPLRTVALPERAGRGAARNAGLRAARGSISVLLDDDIVTTPRFLAAHLEAQRRAPSLCRGPIRELPALVHVEELEPFALKAELSERAAARIERVARTIVAALDEPEACWDQHGSASRLEREGQAALQAGRRAVSWIAFAGANLSAPTAWWLEAPFDERPGTRWGLEDLGRALAFALAGRPLTEAPEARGLHLTHPRGAWKQDLELTHCCIDFLPPRSAASVLQYLYEEIDLDALEAALAELFHSPESLAC